MLNWSRDRIGALLVHDCVKTEVYLPQGGVKLINVLLLFKRPLPRFRGV
jgi:hypothetical protein